MIVLHLTSRTVRFVHDSADLLCLLANESLQRVGRFVPVIRIFARKDIDPPISTRHLTPEVIRVCRHHFVMYHGLFRLVPVVLLGHRHLPFAHYMMYEMTSTGGS